MFKRVQQVSRDNPFKWTYSCWYLLTSIFASHLQLLPCPFVQTCSTGRLQKGNPLKWTGSCWYLLISIENSWFSFSYLLFHMFKSVQQVSRIILWSEHIPDGTCWHLLKTVDSHLQLAPVSYVQTFEIGFKRIFTVGRYFLFSSWCSVSIMFNIAKFFPIIYFWRCKREI